MNTLFEELFLAWCPSYNPEKVPKYLRKDPVRAYGQYAFQVGFQLALSLAFYSLYDCMEQQE